MKIRFPLCRLMIRLALLLMLAPETHAQGPLAPPAGPPAPSMKSLDQIEPRTPISSLPFTIAAPGSYYVTRNLALSAGEPGDGITIQTDNVTLDLGGYSLDGGGTG